MKQGLQKIKTHFKRHWKLISGVTVGYVFAATGLGGCLYHNYQANRAADIGNDSLFNTMVSVTPKKNVPPLRLYHEDDTYKLAQYRVDTIYVDTAYLHNAYQKGNFRVFGFYRDGIITINHFVLKPEGMDEATIQRETKNIKRYNSQEQISSIALHEGDHDINAVQGLKAPGIGDIHFAKVCIHDEIAANIAELLDMREKYLNSGDLNMINDRYKFYKEAVKSGQILPKADKIPADEELRLIANGMRDFWCGTNQAYYEPAHIGMTRRWMRRNFKQKLRDNLLGRDLKDKYNQEYLSRLNDCYTFQISLKDKNGQESQVLVNFLKYMDKDVKISDNVKQAIAIQAGYSLKMAYRQYKNEMKNNNSIKTASAGQSDGYVLIKNIKPDTHNRTFKKKGNKIIPVPNRSR